jgi:hypothetical protein
MYNPARIARKWGTVRLIRDFLIAACLSLLTTGGVCAQEAEPGQLPDAPSVSSQSSPPTAHQDAVVFHKKVFWSLVAVDAASAVADAQTSWHNEQTYPNGRELNSWLYGRKPSLGRYYGTFAVMDGGGLFLSYKLLHSRRKLLRTPGWALLAGLIGQHTDSWIYNVSVRQKTPPAPPGNQ